MKWFILKNLKISIIYSHHRWHEHFIAKKHTNKIQKNIFYFNQIIDLKKAKKYMDAKINNTCIHIRSSLNHSVFLRLKNLICWNVEILWWLFLSNILNLFLIKQNWYLKKREIHCFFQMWFDDAWNVISKNCTIHVKTKSVKKPQWCHKNKMTLSSRESGDVAKAKNNSFKKTDNVRWKQNNYFIDFMIYNHQFVSSKMTIKSLNSFKVIFVKRHIFVIVFQFMIVISLLWRLSKHDRMIEKTMSIS